MLKLTMGHPSGIAAMISSAILALALWPSWAGLWSTWLDHAPHGLVVTALVVWLLWRDRGALRAGARTDWRLVVAAALASVGWFLAGALSVQVVQQVLAVTVLVLWSGLLGGVRVMRTTGPLAATFLLALPVWSVLIRPLQLTTIGAVRGLLSVTGPEAVIRGESITIPSGTFLVEGSCSGLNYLMVALVLGAAYGHLFLQSWRQRALLVATAAFLAMLGNWVRVYGLVLVGHWTEMQSSLMADHVLYGWAIFGATLVPFFVLAGRIEDADRHAGDGQTGPIRVDPGFRTAPGADDDGTRPDGRGWVGVTALGAAMLGPALYLVLFVLPGPLPVRDSLSGVRATEDAWPSVSVGGGGDEGGLPDWTPSYQGYDSVAVDRRRHATDTGRMVTLRRFIYTTQSQGKELVNDLNRIARPDEVVSARMLGPLPPNGRSVNEVVIRRGENWILAWYWFHVAGFDTRSPTVAKLLEVLSLLKRESASELVVVSTPCEPADCSSAAEALAGLVLDVHAAGQRD